MKQLIIGGFNDALSKTATEYNCLGGGTAWTNAGGYNRQVVSTPGTFSNLSVELSAAPGGGGSYIITLLNVTQSTSLAVTITDPATTNINTGSLSVAAGDVIQLQSTCSAPSASPKARWSVIFEGTYANESLLLLFCRKVKTGITYSPIAAGDGFYDSVETNTYQIIPTSGQIKNLFVALNIDPGTAPDAYRFTLRVNGVNSDDGLGNPLQVTITADATTGSDTAHSIPVSPGDFVDLMIEPLNTPASDVLPAVGFTFVADTDGESLILGSTSDTPTLAQIEYFYPAVSFHGVLWGTTEANFYQGGQSGITLKKFYAMLSGTSAQNYALNIRATSKPGDTGIAITITAGNTTGNSGASTYAIGAYDDLSISCLATSGGTARMVYWGLVCYIFPPSPVLVIPDTLALVLTFYAPIISIGSKNLDVFIDGERVVIERKSLRIHTGIEERSTAQFNIIDRLGTSNHKKGQPVEIYDLNNTLIFGGVIEEPGKTRLFKSGGLYYSIHCIDWHYLADKRIAAATYNNGETAGFIFNDLVTNYLAAEGITVGEIQDGPTLVQATINYVKVSEALDALAEKAGFIWFIDENKKIYFIDRDTNAAPWTAEYPYLEPTPILSEGNPLYRNRQYIRGAKALTSEQVEILTGDGNIKAFVVGFPIAQEPTIEVDGVPQTVGIGGIETGFEWYWNKGSNILSAEVAPGDGAVIEVTYIGEYRIIALSQDDTEILKRQALEGGGTGFVEDVASDVEADSKEAAFETGASLLLKYCRDAQKFSFTTRRSGLKAGQFLSINYPPLELDIQMLIESIDIQSDGDDVIYNIVAVIGPEAESWTKFFKDIATPPPLAIDKLNIGEESSVIILVQESETWGWSESVDVVPLICPLPALDLYPDTDLYPC